ncbi:chorismate mutase [Rhodococcus pyridinivorans]|uniref:chorismate mutase n=1 Tax=Rhodococcus pyridinivorans TaxID=103816 RepID=UPI001E587BF4|nr:chorismate mutase [Rhodococcus pyridinivorans]MCD5422359.1 chorismate mutase [Rhodococcus pyridinivorans]
MSVTDRHHTAADAPSTQAAADLADLRAELDDIDRTLLDGIRARLEVCGRVAELKQRHGLDVLQPGRMEVVHRRAQDYAHRHGLSGDFVRSLYTLLIDEACRVEDRIVSGCAPADRVGSGRRGDGTN